MPDLLHIGNLVFQLTGKLVHLRVVDHIDFEHILDVSMIRQRVPEISGFFLFCSPFCIIPTEQMELLLQVGQYLLDRLNFEISEECVNLE